MAAATKTTRAAKTTSTQTRTKRKRVADTTADAESAPIPKQARRRTNAPTSEVIDLTADSPPKTKTKTRKRLADVDATDTPAERRARVFRKHAPKSIQDRLARARTQRMYVVGHSVAWTEDVPEIECRVVGSTGNLYTTVIGKVPSCNCPDAQKGNQCKHILYVLVNALKAPDHLQYQLAFLSSELRDIYHGSPLSRQKEEPEANRKRKPIEGDCPICFMEFELDKEEIVWCRAACGNNIHKTCFQQWAATQNDRGVRCVYCRSAWEADSSTLNLEQLARDGHVNEEGYVNVADQLGMSGERDSSTYYHSSGYRGSSYYGWGRNRSYW